MDSEAFINKIKISQKCTYEPWKPSGDYHIMKALQSVGSIPTHLIFFSRERRTHTESDRHRESEIQSELQSET